MSKQLYSVTMPVHASWTCYVKAESPEEAIKEATDKFEGRDISLCWQCSNDLDTPVVGEAVEIGNTYLLSDPEEIAKAREWIEEEE